MGINWDYIAKHFEMAETKPGQLRVLSKEEAETFMANPTDTDQLLAARGQTHGEFSSQFTFAQKLKALISGELHCNLWQLEALEMIATKISRICCGDPNFPDHWDDIAGYGKLVADKLRADKGQIEPLPPADDFA